MISLNPIGARARSFFQSDLSLRVFSALLAVVVWMAVTLTIAPSTVVTVRDVPVQIDLKGTATGELGLAVIAGGEQTVNVTVSGKKHIVGALSRENFSAYVVLDSVVAPGVYDLKVYLQKSGDFEIVSLSRTSVAVTFDRVVSRTFDIAPPAVGFAVPDGFLIKAPVLSLAQVTVTGPQDVVQRIAAVRPVITAAGVRSETVEETALLAAYDSEGRPVESEFVQFSQSQIKVTVPVLKKDVVGLQIGFLGAPDGFDESTLRYELSHTTLSIAGPEGLVDNLSYLSLGFIDLTLVRPGAAPIALSLSMPAGVDSLEAFTEVEVALELGGYAEKTLRLRDIRLINVPDNIEARAAQGIDVTVVGPEKIIAALAAKDIAASIDLSGQRPSAAGVKLPIEFKILGQTSVWVFGSHEAAVSLTAKS